MLEWERYHGAVGVPLFQLEIDVTEATVKITMQGGSSPGSH